MTLSDIIQAAQGGQGVNNLASQFGLSPEQAQAAIQAMIPAFSTGLQRTAQDPMGLGAILTQMTSGAHQGSFADPSQASAASGPGGAVLGQIFGSPQIAAQIGQQVAQMSGVSAQIVQQMMPIVASMLMGGLAQAMSSQGLGGLMGQLASAASAPGGLGATPGPTAAPPPANPFAGLINSLLGLLGAAQQPGSPPAVAVQAGLNTLNAMFQAGVQVSQAHQQGLNEILKSLSGGKPN
ncbi:MAG: DUF937 domain-containing protein [Roseiarcus sp.]|jgi:hypothetical protein